MMVADSVEDRLQDEISAALLEAKDLAAQLPDAVARFTAAVRQAITGSGGHVYELGAGLGQRGSTRPRQGRRLRRAK